MPKLREQPPTYARRLWAIIEALKSVRQLSNQQLADKIGCSYSTVHADREHPDKIPLSRLLRYFTVLGLHPGKIVTAIETLHLQMFSE